jgi:hypothetical protein
MPKEASNTIPSDIPCFVIRPDWDNPRKQVIVARVTIASARGFAVVENYIEGLDQEFGQYEDARKGAEDYLWQHFDCPDDPKECLAVLNAGHYPGKDRTEPLVFEKCAFIPSAT